MTFVKPGLSYGPASPLSAYWRDLARSHSIVLIRIWPDEHSTSMSPSRHRPPGRRQHRRARLPRPPPPPSLPFSFQAASPPQGISRRRATGGRRFLASPASGEEDGEGQEMVAGSASAAPWSGAALEGRGGGRAPAAGTGLEVSWQPSVVSLQVV
jgi:hypothetical protein